MRRALYQLSYTPIEVEVMIFESRPRRASEQMAGLEPATPVRQTGVSPQHFICKSPGGGIRRDESCVSRAGVEPAFLRSKSPLQRHHLLPAQSATIVAAAASTGIEPA